MHSVKRAVVKWVRPCLAGISYTARRGLIKGMRRKGGFSFIPSSHLSKEEQFLLALDLEGQTVFDVGGWEGVYTLFFARSVGPRGAVVTFEPNPANRQRIGENLALNRIANVTLRPVALGDQSGVATLLVSEGIAGEGHLCTDDPASTNPVEETRNSVITVDLQTLDDEIAAHALPAPSLVKLDVEGFEANVLRGMTETIRATRPALFVEVHEVPERPNNASDVIELLLQHGYTLQHVESGRNITEPNFKMAHSDHVYAK
jgi:FkbM family methyltransferase